MIFGSHAEFPHLCIAGVSSSKPRKLRCRKASPDVWTDCRLVKTVEKFCLQLTIPLWPMLLLVIRLLSSFCSNSAKKFWRTFLTASFISNRSNCSDDIINTFNHIKQTNNKLINAHTIMSSQSYHIRTFHVQYIWDAEMQSTFTVPISLDKVDSHGLAPSPSSNSKGVTTGTWNSLT